MRKKKFAYLVTWSTLVGDEEQRACKSLETWCEAAAVMRSLLIFGHTKIGVEIK